MCRSRKAIQCKHIPDLPILLLLRENRGQSTCWDWSTGFDWATRAHLEGPGVLSAMPPDIPFKLALAKMHMLERRGFIDGCTCGCRGDFKITEKGLDHVENQVVELGELRADEE